MRWSRHRSILWVMAASAALAPAATATPRTKYIVIMKAVQEAKGLKTGILDEARLAVLHEVDKHHELTLERPPDLPTDPDALSAALRARHLQAIEVVLTIVAATRDLKPPAPGKRFRTLTRGIRLSITGSTIPEWLVALTGDGEAEIGAEVGPTDDLDKEGKAVLIDCAKTAIDQAMEEMVSKLRRGAKTGAPPKKKR
jgi:hypothetical protein